MTEQPDSSGGQAREESGRRPSRLGRSARPYVPYLVGALLGGSVVAIYTSTGRPRLAASPAPTRVDPLTAAPSAFEWTTHPPAEFPIPPYAAALRGVSIVIDPGHVGAKDYGEGWKRGPTGLREAAVNLEVARFLAEFLRAVAADVRLTRDRDEYLGLDDAADLKARAEIANRAMADLFLSIHHNAGGPAANHTVVFYHKSPDHSPPSLNAARYLLTGLNDALRLREHSRSALRCDYAMYAGQGFAVLRHATVPAVLVESSFFTNPEEEQRLRDRLYNRREAYGLFIGLARWAQAGLPRVRLLEPADGEVKPREALVFALDDGLGGRRPNSKDPPNIVRASFVVRVDDEPVSVTPDLLNGRLKLMPDAALVRAGKPFWVYIDFRNVYGQHVIHPWVEVRAAGR